MSPRPLHATDAADAPVGTALRLLAALAAGAAMAALGLFEVDPNGAAESLYLAFLATAVLLAVATLAPPPAPELAAGAALAVAASWALPHGPCRGAALGLLLALLLAVAAARRLVRLAPGLPPAFTVPAALALQVLLRGGELLSPPLTLHTLVVFLALPVAGALAVSLLAERFGAGRALAAAALALLLAPGWNVASTLSLLALAAGGWIASPAARARSGWPLAWPFLVAPLVWEPRSGWGAALAGLSLAFPRTALGLAAAAGAAQLAWGGGSAVPGIDGLGWLLLLVPAVAIVGRGTLLPAATALVLAALVPWTPDRAVLAAPLALAALAAGPGEGMAAAAGRFWSAALLAGVTLSAGYPWLRADPLATALSWVGIAPGSPAALGPPAAVLLLAGLERLARRSARLAPWGSSAPAGALAAAVLLLPLAAVRLPPPRVALLPASSEIRLTAAQPSREAGLPPALARSGAAAVVVDSSLANGAALAPGTPVAALRCGGGAASALRAGIETGEWAARRPDVAAKGGAVAPSAWMTTLVNGFFSQRYRARLELPCRDTLRVERSPALPPEVEVVLHAVELEP